MTYFANTILQAQHNTIKRVDFHVAKAKFHEKFRDQLNERQAKVITRVFKEGIDRAERQQLHWHQHDLARDRETARPRDRETARPAGLGREGRTCQDGQATAHALFSKHQ